LFDGYFYRNIEFAYQAAKQGGNTLSGWEYRKRVRNARNSSYAIKYGKSCLLRPNWSEYRVIVMRRLLEQKFSDPKLSILLLETMPVELQFGNNWHDTFWGVCHCKDCTDKDYKGIGLNTLGKMIMEIRQTLTKGVI
jgi:predicted NAD-dependent protein-ADP-ribosyltransferase YbiA (DUF1768 family)